MCFFNIMHSLTNTNRMIEWNKHLSTKLLTLTMFINDCKRMIPLSKKTIHLESYIKVDLMTKPGSLN